MTMRIYVGTYAKYNNGSIAGEWLDLEDYSNESEFYDACRELHSDEAGPEFMFQDFEGFPSNLYSESGGISEIYEYIDFLASTHLDTEIVEAGLFLDIPLENIEEAYAGEFDNDEDFAYDMAEQLDSLPVNAWPHSCIDWERAARELMYDYSEQDGHYFRNL